MKTSRSPSLLSLSINEVSSMPKKKIVMTDDALQRAHGILAGQEESASDLRTELFCLSESYRHLLQKLNKTILISDSYQAQHDELLHRIEETTLKYRQLKDVALPICMYCKKIRSDDDYWQKLETFFCNHADIMFSHGICPDCIKIAYSKMGIKPQKKIISEHTGQEIAAISGTSATKEDLALKEMRAMLRQAAFDGTPLAPPVEQCVKYYAKLLRRFNKTMSITDSYQAQLMELNSRLEMMARTDLLTGLANRWEMTTRIEEEMSRVARHRKTFSILLIDIDRFKEVNDKYGHLCGDRVLRALADTFRANIRIEDICCRWGGEEFLFILPEADLPNARLFADKILDTVRKMSINWEGGEIKVTVSGGYGMYLPDETIDEALRRIDNALYQAKSSGRDQISTAEISAQTT